MEPDFLTAFMILVGLLAIAGVLLWLGRVLMQQGRAERRAQTLQNLLAIFGPASSAVQDDPNKLLAWVPAARAARRLFPSEFQSLDESFGREFPFGSREVDAAHARCTAQWLEWERNHDAEYKLRSTVLEEELERQLDVGPTARAKLDALEREKLQRYQQRYEEYVRQAKALAALGSEARRHVKSEST